MLILGILLIAGAAAGTYFVVAAGFDVNIPIAILDRTFALTPVELYAAGAASAVATIGGLVLVVLGGRRMGSRHQDLRRMRARAAQTERAEREREKAERRLEAAKARRP